MADQEFDLNQLDNILGRKGQRVKMLIVDDSEVVRSEMRRILPTTSIETIEASDGIEGLQQLRAHPDIALVFLDINMPNMDGLTMAEKVDTATKAGHMKKVPIIMLTTEGEKELVIRAKKAGVLAWIIKPPQKAHVLAILEKVLAPKAGAAQRKGA